MLNFVDKTVGCVNLLANKCQKGAHMEFKELAAFELIKCHRENKDEIFYPNGNIKYQRSRNGTFCNCYYELLYRKKLLQC